MLLVYGGESSEHDVSLKSARNVYAALDNDKYNVQLCYIDRHGKWWLTNSIDGSHISQPQLFPALGQRQFIAIPGNNVIRPDVVLPILHGTYGEDGTVQGLCELLHLPCVGPNIIGAAVTMDKDMTKRLLRDAGIPVVPWRVWHASDTKPTHDELVHELGGVLFVKPSRAGSSVGVSKVTSAAGLSSALWAAAEHDNVVLIEQAISAREIELAVLGNNEPIVSEAGEIHPGDEFYSYEDKYSSTSTSRSSIPADLPSEMTVTMQQYALDAYRATGCRGMARVDFFVDPHNHMYLNEINSIPGFTNISMYPKLWHEQGIKYPELIDKLISLALEK